MWAGIGCGQRAPGISFRHLLAFAAPLTVYAIASTGQWSIDIFFVQAMITNSDQTGFYAASQSIARIPVHVMAGLAAMIPPAVAAAAHRGNAEKTARSALRWSIRIAVPATAIIMVTATPLVELLYSSRYRPAGEILTLLAPAMGALAVSSVAAAILTAGRPRASAGLTVLGLATTILGCLLLIPAAGVMGAATATLIGSLVRLVGLLALLWTSLPGSVPLSTVARACVVGGGVALSARLIPVGTVGLVAAFALFGGLTVGLLLVTREVTLDELRSLLNGLWRAGRYEGRTRGSWPRIYPVYSAPAVRIENRIRGQSRIRVNHDGKQTAGSQLFLADSGAPASRNSVSHAATSTLSSRMRRWFGASVSRSLGSASQRSRCVSKRSICSGR